MSYIVVTILIDVDYQY